MSSHIDKLVNRFLAWPLPLTVQADPCACMAFVEGDPIRKHRSGTTLLTADEARQMIEYLLAPLPIAAAAVEPVAWREKVPNPACNGWCWSYTDKPSEKGQPLYTHPAPVAQEAKPSAWMWESNSGEVRFEEFSSQYPQKPIDNAVPLYAAPVAQESTAPTAKVAMDILRDAMQADPEYAWSWHCNLAMMAYDAGASHGPANKWAANFMKIAFDCDTSKNEHYEVVDDSPAPRAPEGYVLHDRCPKCDSNKVCQHCEHCGENW